VSETIPSALGILELVAVGVVAARSRIGTIQLALGATVIALVVVVIVPAAVAGTAWVLRTNLGVRLLGSYALIGLAGWLVFIWLVRVFFQPRTKSISPS
jgi:hypothetical protein